MKFKGGDTNLYGYVLNNPIGLVDPTGEGYALACLAVVTAIGLGVYAAVDTIDTLGGDAMSRRDEAMQEIGGPNHEQAINDIMEAQQDFSEAAGAGANLGQLGASASPAPATTPTAPTAPLPKPRLPRSTLPAKPKD